MNRRTALRKTTLLTASVLGAPTLATLLQSCREQERLSWEPQFLSPDQARFVSAFVDFLLPQTETPGGLDVKTDGEQEPVGFYRQLKSMALWGYFSSEEIGMKHLNYDPIPGEYRGCIPLDEVGGKNWSL